MESSKFFLKFFLKFFFAFILSVFFYQVGFSQDVEKVDTTPKFVKIYGIPVEIKSSTLNKNLNKDSERLQKIVSVVPKFEKRLSAGEKFKYGMERAFLYSDTYIFPAIKTVHQEINEDIPNKDTGDKVADGFSRFAINYGTNSSKELLTSGLYPIIFKQNPRYEPSKKHGFVARILHATSRVFIIKGDKGNLQFNYSQMVGTLSASGVANLWERNTPKHYRVGVKPTFQRFGSMITFDVVNFIVIKEFGPDIKKFFLRR